MIHSAEVGDEVPTFNLDSNMGRISFHDVIDGKWCLLMTFSSAYEPVATTDMGMLAKFMEEFESRNIFVIAVGNDTGSNTCILNHIVGTCHLYLYKYYQNLNISNYLVFADARSSQLSTMDS